MVDALNPGQQSHILTAGIKDTMLVGLLAACLSNKMFQLPKHKGCTKRNALQFQAHLLLVKAHINWVSLHELNGSLHELNG